MPALPGEVGHLRLLGARYCPLLGLSLAPHVYYQSPGSHVSVFVVPHGVRLSVACGRRGRRGKFFGLEGRWPGSSETEADVRAVESAPSVLAAWSLLPDALRRFRHALEPPRIAGVLRAW
jgi:hypothetical protein